jgi:hypothetical protein
VRLLICVGRTLPGPETVEPGRRAHQGGDPQEHLPAKAAVRGSAHVEAEETCSYPCRLFFSACPEQYLSIQATAAYALFQSRLNSHGIGPV